MARYGTQYGPDITFLGIPPCDLIDPSTYDDADVAIVGAPFDGGTSHRPGTRFGPRAMSQGRVHPGAAIPWFKPRHRVMMKM